MYMRLILNPHLVFIDWRLQIASDKRRKREIECKQIELGKGVLSKFILKRLWFPISLAILSLVLFFVSNYTPDSVSGVPTVVDISK